MAQIILGVTGSVAAIRTPALYAALHGAGHLVRVVATEAALYFFDPRELGPPDAGAEGGPLYRDADEWPAPGYRRGDPVLHIAFRDWADLLIVAPLDANTLAKFALGLSDNFLTCLFRAWDFSRPVVLAPAMNTLMWQSPVTLRHLRQLLADRGDGHPGAAAAWPLDAADEVFARHAPRLVLVPPQAKRLACGDFGVGAMAEVATLAETVRQWANLAQDQDQNQDPVPADPLATAQSLGRNAHSPVNHARDLPK
jgi:phosphopantothenoylcysteine decarboxylase